MILIESWLKNSKELTKFVKKIGAMEGVTRICPAIILEKVK
jgi:Lrp/AsnC family transcriptional regulator for asnA, asnC and gidA